MIKDFVLISCTLADLFLQNFSPIFKRKVIKFAFAMEEVKGAFSEIGNVFVSSGPFPEKGDKIFFFAPFMKI